MDGGQGFVKISLNILDKEQSPIEPNRYKYSAGVAPRTQKDSSVKKSFVLSIIADMKELYFNIALILSFFSNSELHHVW